ncbi:hypothetical protein MSUIS_01120 [Mycoplasma suis KI3806]|uniref:Uncharacterized protein n=1 Tax=Mycoplasma suis (strain KI_3806) TaxID=708248 RepID=F0V2Y3_MYCS3|nr:hypothetical protein [Mycoplasma suis]CBZ40205.1 hypothetical protein MSUIS_01120 [Mycoplasma suis KI3806]
MALSISGLTKIATTLLSIGGTIGGSSYGILSLVGMESKQNEVIKEDSKLNFPETGNRNPLSELKGTQAGEVSFKSMSENPALKAKKVIKENQEIAEIFYKDSGEDNPEWMSCEKRRKGQNLSDVSNWGWNCKSWFNQLWREWRKKGEQEPEAFFKIEEDYVREILEIYFGSSSFEYNSQLVEKLKEGVSLNSANCQSKEIKNGRLTVFCNLKKQGSQTSR